MNEIDIMVEEMTHSLDVKSEDMMSIDIELSHDTNSSSESKIHTEIPNEIKNIIENELLENECDIEMDHRSVCRMLNINVHNFHNNIYVPFAFFKNDNWDIEQTLQDNSDVLFFNESYMTDEDKKRFNVVFHNYLKLILKIMSNNPSNKLIKYLTKWTNIGKIRWTAKKTNSFLKTLINSDDYYIISPEYIVSQFLEIKKSCPNKNFKEIQKNLKEHLNEILQTAFEYIDNFRMSYDEIVSSYVYEHPLEYKFGSNYVKGFINTIILLIIDLVDDLISLHVYAIHPIISDIINVYTPLDIVNEFYNDNNNKELYIV